MMAWHTGSPETAAKTTAPMAIAVIACVDARG
jgi:hypothetical protein